MDMARNRRETATTKLAKTRRDLKELATAYTELEDDYAELEADYDELLTENDKLYDLAEEVDGDSDSDSDD